ncbi:cytochrome P450 [Algirhabdus cladophorae]|uniref:cytochrome P450 n=1 Tax=Algirhabdus cladophorae TaxID=3377108 RepID=UPI003B84A615
MTQPLPLLHQQPTDPAFVQNPYPFYAKAHALGAAFHWAEYQMDCVVQYDLARRIFSHPAFGRADPNPAKKPDHLTDFWAVEDHSMLELEAPRHPVLRKQVLRAFTSRRVRDLAPEITALAHQLIDAFPSQPFDLLTAYAQQIPVIVIARLLGVPDHDAPRLLAWSHDIVKMYQAQRSHADEVAANTAAAEFSNYVQTHIDAKRCTATDDLLSAMIAEEALTGPEIVSTAILLLNAGHEATVHTMGNAVVALINHACPASDPAIEEAMRFDPPLHLFTRWVYEDVILDGVAFHKGQQIALLLAAANRDPARWDQPHRFDPSRVPQQHLAFGAGGHFCLGAPLARLELGIGLRVLFQRCPDLQLVQPPQFADIFHFHGLDRLIVQV